MGPEMPPRAAGAWRLEGTRTPQPKSCGRGWSWGNAGWLPSLLNSALLVVIGILGLAQLLIAHQLTTLQAIGFGSTLALLGFIAGTVLWGVRHRSRLTAAAIWIAERWVALRRRAPVTVVVILTYRLISFWLPALAGFPLVLYLQRATRGRSVSAEHNQTSGSPPWG